MTYTLSLKSVGIITGIFLLLLHAPAIFQKNSACAWLQKFPRSKFWGLILLSLATLWIFLLTMKMDLGEFSRLRLPIMGFVLLSALLSWQFLDEFLSVRSLGVLAMLAAHPILDACFLQSPSWRLILVVLAYIWIICGLLWVGMPYLLRDQIAWICASPWRWNVITSIGIITGLVILGYSLGLVI
jgi:hypothetical protein